MKLLRYGHPGRELPGVLDGVGVIRDLSAELDDFRGETLPQTLAYGRTLDIDKLPVIEGPVRLGPPIGGVRKIVLYGENYAAHMIESGRGIPKNTIFMIRNTG